MYTKILLYILLCFAITNCGSSKEELAAAKAAGIKEGRRITAAGSGTQVPTQTQARTAAGDVKFKGRLNIIGEDRYGDFLKSAGVCGTGNTSTGYTSCNNWREAHPVVELTLDKSLTQVKAFRLIAKYTPKFALFEHNVYYTYCLDYDADQPEKAARTRSTARYINMTGTAQKLDGGESMIIDLNQALNMKDTSSGVVCEGGNARIHMKCNGWDGAPCKIDSGGPFQISINDGGFIWASLSLSKAN